jgi:cytochrome c2
MAATDQPYRSQKTLDVVFAVSAVLMLLSMVWMFADDYNREYKTEQREFRDVVAALAQRSALEQLPSTREFEDAVDLVKVRKIKFADIESEEQKARDQVQELKAEVKSAKGKAKAAAQRRLARAENYAKLLKAQEGPAKERDEKVPELRAKAAAKLPYREKADARYQDIKAKLDSRRSFYDLEVQEHSAKSDKAQEYKDEIVALQKELEAAQSERDALADEIKEYRARADAYEQPLTKALGQLKKVTDRFDGQVNTAIQKQWGFGDWARNLPVIDAFASPIKIQQITLEKLPIDYNFKYVTRFDRCMTCHQGIDKNGFTREQLRRLTKVTDAENARLDDARAFLEARREALQGLPDLKNAPRPEQFRLTELSENYLTDARINEFCVHPRLKLFVGAESKHPSLKFGCTTCHGGQGSATSFTLASHSPNNSSQEEHWKDEHGWYYNHDWDFPMQPMRFVESSCLQCHHQVTDLVSADARNEAPKLLRGYNLLRESGCFGCHEIHGRNKGVEVGPDIRLENVPPLEQLTPTERDKILADPDNAPGNMRKVGPSLYRVVEKTNEEWVAKWLRGPRDFRPETKMPHFYGLSNNNPNKLSDELDGKTQLQESQLKFPDAEIRSIVYYLFQASDAYLKEVSVRRKDDARARAADQQLLEQLEHKPLLSKQEKQELEDAQTRMRERQTPDRLSDLRPKGYKEDISRGRKLFSERGCLACHHHDATDEAGNDLPAIPSEADFGPTLSQVKAKLGDGKGNMQARIWLMNWVKDPHVHSPRSRMPVTHLTDDEAADVAAWLLSQEPTDLGPEWAKRKVPQPDAKTLQDLINVYLVRQLAPYEIEKFHKGTLPADKLKTLGQDEITLASHVVKGKGAEPDAMKYYLGKKAVARLGCFGCHDIPGFDHVKNIGVELNDWGKKDPARIAFEDSNHFLEHNFWWADKLTDKKGKPVGPKVVDGKRKLPYERYFADALLQRHREGFLSLKLMDPRSYDYNGLRAWDDQARMPQFKFARLRQKKGENARDYEARRLLAEAEARDAVMTFILGLVAEPIPMEYQNAPKGDRLAEVKGLQVLEKFNCGGCHLIRPGVYDFKMTPKSLEWLEFSRDLGQRGFDKSDYNFPDHNLWAGVTPATGQDVLRAYGSGPSLMDNPKGKGKILTVRLAAALRYRNAKDKLIDLRASNRLVLAPEDMVYPPPAALKSAEKFGEFNKDQGPFGGAFGNLLSNYLPEVDPKAYPNADSNATRASVPPPLINEGERTQPNWLYQFLLDPQPVRRMTVLRMPRFNMSPDEARALVAYFAGVERLTNPGVELTFPLAVVPQQADLSDAFWRDRTAQYVARLKEAPGGLFDKRLAELQPAWERIQKDNQARAEEVSKNAKAAKERLDSAQAALKKAEAALTDEKDAGKKEALEKAKKAAEDAAKAAEGVSLAWDSELKRAQEQVQESTVEAQKARWLEREAYVTDAFRLFTDRNLCMKCHQIGNIMPGELKQQGPPLALASKRLRPGWVKYWVAHPQRFLPYDSVMPQYFPMDDPTRYQELFPGTALDRIRALRDVLMIWPRAQEMPLNQQWLLPAMVGTPAAANAKTNTKKNGAK